jgi:hypothetical protein
LGLHALERLDGSPRWQPWRLPPAELATAASKELEAGARHAAGARFDFVTDVERVTIAFTGAEDSSALDVVVDGGLHARVPITLGEQSPVMDLPAGSHRLEIWLPQSGENLLGPIDLDGVGSVVASAPRPLRWVTYGSSITQCSEADGPSDTWPAIVATSLDWDLTNLGFGGQCHLDPVAARTIRDADYDVISLCIGINIYGAASFSERSLHSAICGFVETVREGHPGVPIVMMSPITAPSRESVFNQVGLTLSDVRRIVTHASQTLQRLGDEQLTLIEGRDVFGEADTRLLADDVHPTAAGYRLIAQRIAPVLRVAAGPPAANLATGSSVIGFGLSF